ncbi:MAG: inosine/xanthosine triphosphatase [Nanoarchaeota archaeon]|nr:inosine/xanthosine triphosphatase [Nanoarchaeota archaeon]
MLVLVGSKNPVKIEATKEAFTKYFDQVKVLGIEVDSGVPSQPVNHQTYHGARNRALTLKRLAQEKYPNATYFVGIEGGIEETNSIWFSFGLIHVIDINGRESVGKSPHFILPNHIVQKLLAGEELGKVMDHHTGQENTKQKMGTVGILTHGKMDRKELYIHGLTMALIPFVNENLYFSK